LRSSTEFFTGNPLVLRTPLRDLWFKGGIIVDELLIWAHIVMSDRVELVGERQQLVAIDMEEGTGRLKGTLFLFFAGLPPQLPPSFKAALPFVASL
jgi:hypothetical protein